MEGKPMWTEMMCVTGRLQDWMVTDQNGRISGHKRAHQEVNRQTPVWRAVGKDAFILSQPDDCLESCRGTARGDVHGEIFWLFLPGTECEIWLFVNLVSSRTAWTVCWCLVVFLCVLGVWLCFICCPLQGGFNLQPAHVSVKLNLSLFELEP